jgi:hypothetical protein
MAIAGSIPKTSIRFQDAFQMGSRSKKSDPDRVTDRPVSAIL